MVCNVNPFRILSTSFLTCGLHTLFVTTNYFPFGSVIWVSSNLKIPATFSSFSSNFFFHCAFRYSVNMDNIHWCKVVILKGLIWYLYAAIVVSWGNPKGVKWKALLTSSENLTSSALKMLELSRWQRNVLALVVILPNPFPFPFPILLLYSYYGRQMQG